METLLSKNQHNLIDRSQQFDVNILEDLLMIAAANFEDSLTLAGARPGIDYTILDLYKLSNPFALLIFKKNSDCCFTTGHDDGIDIMTSINALASKDD